MKTNSAITEERLRKSVAEKSGCTPLFLRVLKSDLQNLLTQYMKLSGIDFSVSSAETGYNLRIDVSVNEFTELGMNE